MALLDITGADRDMRSVPFRDTPTRLDERAARRALSTQIARLERDLGDVQVSSFPHGGAAIAVSTPARLGQAPRLLGLAELEHLRGELAERLRTARRQLEARGREQEQHRVRLERMLLAPGKHKFETVSNKQLGEGGCGVWQVRPRLGLVGMLAGWWHVKLSSGCPLATARRRAPGPADGKEKSQANRAPRPGCSFSGSSFAHPRAAALA
jgi:hypothetical protein